MRLATTGSTPNPCVPSSASPLNFKMIRWNTGPWGFWISDFEFWVFFVKDDPFGSLLVDPFTSSNRTKGGRPPFVQRLNFSAGLRGGGSFLGRLAHAFANLKARE